MKNRNNDRSNSRYWEAGGEDFSKNAVNSRDDVQRSWDSYSEYDHRDQQSAGQQYGNFHRNAGEQRSYSSDYDRVNTNDNNNYRGANQFGLSNRVHGKSFDQESRYYRGGNYGRMNEELNRYDQSFGERHNDPRSFGTQQYDYSGQKQYGRYSPEAEGYYGRNSSDYRSSRYTDNYYYRPNSEDTEGLRSTYGSEHQSKLSNYYGRHHSDYFDQHSGHNERGAQDYYGSYPSYNQSGTTDRDWEDEHPNIRDRRSW